MVKIEDLALKLAALAAAGQSPALTFEDVCVPAKALSLSGEDPGSVAVLAWLNRLPLPLPWRVEAVEVVPFVTIADVDTCSSPVHCRRILTTTP